MRVQVELPERVGWSSERPVGAEHVNSAGHLDACRLLSMVDAVRGEYMRACDLAVAKAAGLGYVLADQIVTYRSEAFAGELLRFDLMPHDFNRYGLDIYFRVSAVVDGREIARGKNGLVFFDHRVKRIAPMPDAIRRRLGAA